MNKQGNAFLNPKIIPIFMVFMCMGFGDISGLMVTAIVGGAFIPLLMGYLQDFTSILTGFIVPVLCIGYIAYIAFSNTRTKKVMYSDL